MDLPRRAIGEHSIPRREGLVRPDGSIPGSGHPSTMPPPTAPDESETTLLGRRAAWRNLGILVACLGAFLGVMAAAGNLHWDDRSLQVSFYRLSFYAYRFSAAALVVWAETVALLAIAASAGLRRVTRRIVSAHPAGAIHVVLALAGAQVILALVELTEARLFVFALWLLIQYLVVRGFETGAVRAAGGAVCRFAVLRPIVVLLALSFALLLPIAWIGYGGLPLHLDSACQYFQCKLIWTGRFKLPPPPVTELFLGGGMAIDDQGWYSQYPPGHTLLMVLFETLGAAWMLNVVCGSGCVTLIFQIGRRLYGERTAWMAALLLCASFFFQYMQTEMMSHGSTMFLVMLAAWLAIRLPDSRTPRRDALLIGVTVGWACITRPLTAAGLFTPLLVWSLVRIAPRLKGLPVLVVICLMGFVVIAAIFPIYNHLTTGHAFLSAYRISNPAMHQLGFHDEFTPLVGTSYCLNNLWGMNHWLFAWPAGSYLPLLLFVVVCRKTSGDWLMLSMAAGLSAAYWFYGYQDFVIGPRFLYEAVFCLVLLSARGIMAFVEMMRECLGEEAGKVNQFLRWAVVSVIAPLVIFSAVAHGRLLARHMEEISVVRDVQVKFMKEFGGRDDSVVFTHGIVRHFWLFGHLNFPRGTWYPWNIGEKNRELIAKHPEKKYYLYVDDQLFEYDDAMAMERADVFQH